MYACKSAWERRILQDEQCVQRGSFYWNTVREMSERYRLTLSAVRWNTPRDALEWALPGREGGSRIPTLCRKREGEKYNKKENREKQDTKKPHHCFSFSPRKVLLYFPVVLLCKSKRYMLQAQWKNDIMMPSSEILQNKSYKMHIFPLKMFLRVKCRSWAFNVKNTC